MAEDEGRGVEGQESCHTGEVHRILPDFFLIIGTRKRLHIWGKGEKTEVMASFSLSQFSPGPKPCSETKLQKMSTNLLVLKKAV